MKHIEDNIALLGLITTTIPFKYEENTVTAAFSGHIEKADLENIIQELTDLKEHALTDDEKLELSDELYFINQIMENLGMN